MFIPSPEQKTFLDWVVKGKGSCILTAVAGAGKTSVITEACKLMKGNVIFLAYNKKIVEELKQRIPKSFTNVNISTVHAAGLSIWKKANPKVIVDANKCRNIFRKIIDSKFAPYEGSVISLVNYAKQRAIGYETSIDDISLWKDIIEHFDVEVFDEEDLVIEMAMSVYKKSIETDHEIIDFEDMINASLIHGCKIPEYDFVVVDEAADLNTSRRAIAVKMKGEKGRLVAVGDPFQAINAWCGANPDSLDILGKMVNAIQLPLSVSFRCPQSVVKEAQKYVNHIQPHESAPVGSVTTLSKDQNIINEAKAGDAILCRFNAPLVKLVYKFIAEGIAAKITGREIGSGLQVLARKYKVKNFSSMIDKLNDYKDKQSFKLRAKENESAAVAIEDKVECLKVIIERVMKIDASTKNPVERVCQEIDSIFEDTATTNCVNLMSIHRSKGLEFTNVYWLQTGANKRAKKDWQIESERNLSYVATTRAKKNLIHFAM